MNRRGCSLVLACSVLLTFSVLGFAATPDGTPPQTARIAFAGDSIVDNYWSGAAKVVAANTCLKGRVELGRYARNGTGLSRGDKLYWPREILRIVGTFKPNVVVLSIGLNDRQFLVDGAGHRTAWGAPDWSDRYRQEILAFLRGASSGGAAVLLVGLPIMRDAVDNADVQQKNAMYIEAIAALGNGNIQYVDPWKLDPAASVDRFSSFGRNKKGRMVQIRTGDGQHFTDAGEDVVADYLFPKIAAAADRQGAQLEQCFGRQAGAQ